MLMAEKRAPRGRMQHSPCKRCGYPDTRLSCPEFDASHATQRLAFARRGIATSVESGGRIRSRLANQKSKSRPLRTARVRRESARFRSIPLSGRTRSLSERVFISSNLVSMLAFGAAARPLCPRLKETLWGTNSKVSSGKSRSRLFKETETEVPHFETHPPALIKYSRQDPSVLE